MSRIPSKFRIPFIILIAGLIAEITFEIYAWVVSPRLFGETLEPAKLVKGLFGKYLGAEISYAQAFFIHFLVGAILFSLAVYLVSKLMKPRYILAGLITGFGLWFIAQGILAPLMGRAFMMDFGPYTQSSFFGHTGMTLIIGYIFSRAFKNGWFDPAYGTPMNKAAL